MVNAMNADLMWRLAADGRLFFASDADENDLVTGQTSFAATTPTFILRVPTGTVCVPMAIDLSQTGTVAGGDIGIIAFIDPDTDRWASGGTSETVTAPSKEPLRTPACTLYTGATAAAFSNGGRIWGATVAADVSPAEGAVQGPFWRPAMPYRLVGPASLLVYTYAATTGPTWFWSFHWAEALLSDNVL